jgi:hypothetical protein
MANAGTHGLKERDCWRDSLKGDSIMTLLAVVGGVVLLGVLAAGFQWLSKNVTIKSND